VAAVGQAPSSTQPRVASPSLGAAAGTCILAGGLTIGLRPLADNSFFTHLATGRLILDHGSVPTVDPYTFTAAGHSWVVQSWLASLLYATAEAIGGAVGLRLLMGLIAGVVTLLAWRLTRPADGVVARLVLGALVVGIGAELWSERPLMLGLAALAAVALAAEGGMDPRWMVPIGWLWVNVHGSFPIGIAYLLVVLLGRRLDGGGWKGVELDTLRWSVVGMLLGAVSPVGPRLLVFPLELLRRQDVLQNVIEWRAPTFDSLSQRLFVVQLAVAILLLVRRPSYRFGLVIAVFGAAALLGSRNLTVASIAFLPGMAGAVPAIGSLRSADRSGVARLLAVAGVAGCVLLGASRLSQPDYELHGYPVDAVAFLDEEGVDMTSHRVATQDIVGNFLELVYGADQRVFYDDRFDMFPDEISQTHLALVRSAPGVTDRLADLDVDVVVWSRSGAVMQRFIVDPDWRVLYTDENAAIVCRRGADLAGSIGTC
jgi:hypothetical protein